MALHHAAVVVILRWLGQACFLITSAHGTPVLIDPPNPQVGYPIAAHSIKASAVFVSHEHFDHNWTDAAAGSPTIVQPIGSPAPDQTGSVPSPGDTPPAIAYTRVFAYHDNVQGAQRGPDTLTVLSVDGLRIAHLGDLGQLALTPSQLKSLGRIDVLMIPVGGYFTIDAQQATKIVDQLKPRVILPMHYRTPVVNQDLQQYLHPVDEFAQAMAGKADVVHLSARDLALDPKSLPKKQTVYILRYE